MYWKPFCLIALLAQAASAATYYVSPAGRDSSPGTLAAPLRTITAGVDRLHPGDRLLVRGGVYHETVRVWEKHGSLAAQIRIERYGRETPVIDGGRLGGAGVVSIGRSSWVYLDGFVVRNGASQGIFVYDSQQVRVRWNDVHDNAGAGIDISSGSNSPRGTTHHIVVQGNRVHHNVLSNRQRKSARWSQAVAAWRSADLTIAGNYVFENFGEGIDAVVCDRVVIAANHVWDNFAVDIYLDNATNAVVDRNFILSGRAKNARDYYRSGQPAIGIATANERYDEQNPLRALTITNNIVLFCRFAFAYGDWDRGGGIRGAVIANNTFYGAGEAAIYLEPVRRGRHSSVRVVGNIVFQRGNRPYVSGPVEGVSFRANCWWGGRPGSRRIGAGDVVRDPLLIRAGGGTAEDYQLGLRSPCIDRAVAEPAVRTDFLPMRRGAAPDLGAWERPR